MHEVRAPELRRGTRLGKYQLVSRLGEGAASQVWKARDTIEGQLVAVKIPNGTTPGSDEEEELLIEIRLGARLNHPNILRIKNADRVAGRYVIISELAVESLEERLRRRLATGRALDYGRQILEGLAYAHGQRVIHRDIKPANIMVFDDDHVRIGDFGLARVSRHTILSATGSGTVLYAAPEQVQGYPTFASDVFSAGLVFHEMLTGTLPRWPFEWPFAGHAVLRRRVPEEVARIIYKATRPNYRLRYHDARAMLAALLRTQPAVARMLHGGRRTQRRRQRLGAWREVRFRECQKAFGKPLSLRFRCSACQGPLSEHMACCPWCGTPPHFAEGSEHPLFCPRCRRGLKSEWRFCPWCWGSAFPDATGIVRADPRYQTSCAACKDPLMHGMRYCPWCHARVTRAVRIDELPDRCPHCRGSVVLALWEHCPWCERALEE